MKYFRLFFLLIAGTFFIASCQKELSYEAGIAKGSLKKDGTGECLPFNVNGSYQKDSTLKAISNYVDVQVNISEIGSYSIKTDSVNGYSFSAAGVVNVTGLNTIRLIGAGKPLAGGADMFTVKFDTSVCQFNIVVNGAGGGGGGSTAAIFTLVGMPTTCTGAVQSNNFYATMPANSSNYVDIKADVTTAGTYTINAPLVNGVSFSATGSLVVGSNQNIRLLASGTPATAGSFSYALNTTTPASNCGFNLTVQAAPTPAMYTFECPSSPIFYGTYQAGVSTAGDSVQINVTSVAGGSYSITTSTTASSNSVVFTGSGVLPASASPQMVTLYANGTPATAGTFTYMLTGMGVTSTCTFTQTYSTATTANGTLKFNIGSVTKTFNFMNSADTSFITPPPPAPPGNFYVLSVAGDAGSPSQEKFSFDIIKTAPYFTNGATYTVNQFMQSIILNITYTDNSGTIYTASTDGSTQNPAFSISITSITTTKVIGTFSGPVKNSSGVVITTTQGSFDLPLQ